MKNSDQVSYKRIIIVAYRLPFKLVKKKGGYIAVQNSGGLVSAILSLSEKMKPGKNEPFRIRWVGTGEAQLGKENLNPNFELFPVEITVRLNDKYYGGFCNDTIWPLFHYFPDRTVYDNSYFDAYKEANNLFFNTLKDLIKPGDFVWVHDYQLFLLPDLLRNSFPDINIGFFLHIPFPSFEIFRLFPRPWREAILKGMTGADVVGFHTNDYAQHFIKSVKRTLGYRVDQNFIQAESGICKADAFPIGIDYNKFHNQCTAASTINYKKKLQNQLMDHKLIFSIDRLDYSKGLLHRLYAFERFLEKFPNWHYNVIFNMIVIPSRDNIEGYREIKKELEATVGRINGKYSNLIWRPIIYQYQSVPFNELVAIYNLSNVALITPLRDGMNLVAKEFVACQTEDPGILILSEMTGAADELNESIIINPTDIEETSDAIDKALKMPADEKEKRILKMQNRLKRYDVFKWSSDFFSQVADTRKVQEQSKVIYIDNDTLEHIQDLYIKSRKRLFLLDYDGTLTPFSRLPETAVLNEKTEKLILSLTEDNRNTVVIISGRDKVFMENQFRNINVTMVAEHGYQIKYPDRNWENSLELDLSWKKKILPVLNDYVDRCNGSFIEEKFSSIAWHFRNASEDTALLRINELKDDLDEILKSESKLHLLEGDKVLEVKSILYDKGTAASLLIGKKKYDFILALGDDSTDEDLFMVIPKNSITIKVGNKPSAARFNIRNQSQVYKFLSMFTGVQEKILAKA